MTKYVKMKVEEEKGIKFNFNKTDKVKFCIVSLDKEERSTLHKYFQNHGIKVAHSFKNSSPPDCVLVESIYEIEEEPLNIFVLDFDLKIETLLILLGKFNSSIHVFLSQKALKRQRIERLMDMVNAFSLKDIMD